MTRKTTTLLTSLYLLLFSLTVFAQGYERIESHTPDTSKGNEKIEVVEWFWYGCPHCYHLEPELNKWLKKLPEGVSFKRIPAVLGDVWIAHAKAFYIAKKTNIIEQVHPALFDALHRKKEELYGQKSLRKFFSRYGVKKDEFDRLYNSKEIDNYLKESVTKARTQELSGVPAITVNGKYLTSATLAGSHKNMLRVVTNLIQKEKKLREKNLSKQEENTSEN